MTAITRVLAVLVAYALACVAASVVLTIGTLTPHWNEWSSLAPQSSELQSAALWAVILLGTVVIAGIAFLPALLVIVLAEGFAWRSVLVYGALGGALALGLRYGLDFAGYVGAPGREFAREREVMAAAGIAGGLVYWLVAGRRAGAWKS